LWKPHKQHALETVSQTLGIQRYVKPYQKFRAKYLDKKIGLIAAQPSLIGPKKHLHRCFDKPTVCPFNQTNIAVTVPRKYKHLRHN
jgi:hypothetical protein